MNICRVPNCPKPQQALGVCAEHLSVITKQVNAGQATWKQYEEAGICLPLPKPKNRINVCLTNKCFTPPRSRGLCDNCYAAAVRTMKKENLQWPDLEQLGLSRPARRREFVKQSFFQEAAKLAIEEKAAKDRINYSLPLTPAPPEQPISVTQTEPIPLTLPPEAPSLPPALLMLHGVPLEDDAHLGQQEAAPQKGAFHGWNELTGQPPTLEQMKRARENHDFQPPVLTPERELDVTLQGVPIVYDPTLDKQDEILIAPARLAQQIPEAVQVEKTPPVTLAGEPITELDLSRINAPDPEPQEPALEPQSFPSPPTQIPGQEN